MRFWYLSHMQAARGQISLRKHPVGSLLLAHTMGINRLGHNEGTCEILGL